MLTGAAAVTRSSTGITMKVCVPPPEAPVQPMRSGSTSGRSCRKSMALMLFQSCRPMRLMPQSSRTWAVSRCSSWVESL